MVAGPNGSGKSSLHQNADFEEFGKRSVWIINPDALALRIKEIERLSATKANFAAVQRIERWIEASIEAHQTIGVETVLSTKAGGEIILDVELAPRDLADAVNAVPVDQT